VLQHGIVWRQFEVLEEYIASIFKVENKAVQDIRQSALLRLLFDPEDGGNMFLQKIGFSKLNDVQPWTIPFIATIIHNIKKYFAKSKLLIYRLILQTSLALLSTKMKAILPCLIPDTRNIYRLLDVPASLLLQIIIYRSTIHTSRAK
jgi:hypothetical protein